MIEAAIIGLRALQYGTAALLFGLPAFLIYSGVTRHDLHIRWPRSALLGAAVVLVLTAPAALVAHTAVMTGSLTEAIKPQTLGTMISAMALGAALVVRAIVAFVALAAILLIKPGARLWWITAGLGGIITASFAWTGHGAATEGPGHEIHLVSDILHALAASLWIGALAAFSALACWRPAAPSRHDMALTEALSGFARVGTWAVAVLVMTGLINSLYLVSWNGLPLLAVTLWGQLLIAKLGLFMAMIVLATLNRFQLTARLKSADAGTTVAIGHLRASLLCEFGLAIAVLALVAVMGTLAPPASLG